MDFSGLFLMLVLGRSPTDWAGQRRMKSGPLFGGLTALLFDTAYSVPAVSSDTKYNLFYKPFGASVSLP